MVSMFICLLVCFTVSIFVLAFRFHVFHFSVVNVMILAGVLLRYSFYRRRRHLTIFMHFIFVVVMFRAVAHPFRKCIYFIYFSENILSYLLLTLSVPTLCCSAGKKKNLLRIAVTRRCTLITTSMSFVFLLSDANIVITFNSCSLFSRHRRACHFYLFIHFYINYFIHGLDLNTCTAMSFAGCWCYSCQYIGVSSE